MWEHEWAALKAKKPDIGRFLATLDIQPRLDPKNAFFGGRTDGQRLFYQVSEGEKIQYYDFTSLYPTVQKYDRFPVGHPTAIITSDFKDIHTYFGFVKCVIHPPRQLLHPVLPVRMHGKLTFPLCRTCAEEQHQGTCTHDRDARALTGTWATPEFHKALEQGYELVALHEVYHWDDTTIQGPESEGLFTPYVQAFLKLKTQASGFPEDCQTDAEKRAFIRTFEEKEGVRLDYDKMEKKPGLRCLSKYLLNCLWGKYGQRINLTQSQFITKEEDFYKALANPTKTLNDWHLLNEDLVRLDFQHTADFIPESNSTNIFLAAFVTSHARMRLYALLELLGDRVLYYDTDSVLFVERPGQPSPPLGDFLGDLTSEIPLGRYIIQFVCCGAKNYGYMLDNGECFIKIKGFTLNYANSQKMQFTTMCDQLFLWHFHGTSSGLCLQNPSSITRDKNTSTIFNKPGQKEYRVVYDKRVVLPNLESRPYGY
jgi:hypothetical protein